MCWGFPSEAEQPSGESGSSLLWFLVGHERDCETIFEAFVSSSDTVYVGLGSNLGDREENLSRARDALRSIDAVAVLRCSSLFDSAPVMRPESGPQPRYLNAVVEMSCGLDPKRLLNILKHIENDFGRLPGPRWSPRVLDLDVLLWDGRLIAEPMLQVPHLELHKRQFVLEPLCELVPDYVHPIIGKSLKDLLRDLAPQDVRPHPAIYWPSHSQDSTEG